MTKFTKLWRLLMILLISSSVLVAQAQTNVSSGKANAKAEQKKDESLIKKELNENIQKDMGVLLQNENANYINEELMVKGLLTEDEKEASAAIFSGYNDPNVYFSASPEKGGNGAKSVVVTIGTGTLITSGTTSNVTPYKTYWMDGQDQFLFTKAELNAAGLGGGNITALAFNVGGTPNPATLNSFTISMQHTALTALTGFTTTGWTTCYTGNVVAVAGWNTYTFTTAFNWDDTQNILVKVCFNNSAYTSNSHVYYTTTTGNLHAYWNGDLSSASGCDQTTGTPNTSRANVQITGEPVSTPLLTVNPASLNFGYVPSGGSAELSYILAGTNLTAGPIVITAPSNFQVSLTSGSGFANSINVTYTPPTLANTTIYVKFSPTAPNTVYTGNVTNVGGGASANVALSGSSYFYLLYCLSNATSVADEDIFNVTVGTLNNTSDCNTTAPGPGSIKNQYSNYTTTVAAPSLPAGTSPAFSVQIGTCGTGSYANAIKIFIDFNIDGDFADAGEEVYVSPASSTGPHTETGVLPIPAGATVGTTMMRVVNVETTLPSGILACGTYTWGETEDYLVDIVPATTPTLGAVPGTLNFGYVTAGTTSSELSYVLSGVALSPASGNIAVTAPADFKVSLTTGGPYTQNISVPYSGGALAGTTIYVVFQPPTANQSYSGTITNVGGGASVNVAVSGTTILQYCTSNLGGSGVCPGDITVVQANTLLNTDHSNCVVANGSTYGNYPPAGTNTTTLYKTLPFDLSVTTNDAAIESVWFDFDQDGVLETTEWWQITTASVANVPSTVSITIPSSAVEGLCIMRIRSRLSGNTNGAGDACTNFGSGICEDYYVTIAAPTSPYLSAIPGTLDFGTIPSGTTTVLSYALSGANLTPAAGNIAVTAPANFFVSLSATGPWTANISVPYAGGVLSSTPVYVQFAPTAPSTTYTGNVTNAGGGATTVNVAVTGKSSCDAFSLNYCNYFDDAAFPQCWTQGYRACSHFRQVECKRNCQCRRCSQ